MSRRIQYVLTAALLALIVVTAACGGTPAPTNTPVPPTNTPVPPTNTPLPPTNTPSIPMAAEQRIHEGGFAFRPPKDYEVMPFGPMAYLSAPGADETTGPLMMLVGGSNAGGLVEEGATTEELMAAITEGMAESNITMSEPKPILLAGVSAISVDISGEEDGVQMAGRIVAAQPAEKQAFILLAISTAEKWPAFSQDVEAVLGTISFFAPVAATMEPSATSGPLPTARPTQSGMTEARQWATGAAASSEYDFPNWSAAQATGAPNVTACGDDARAWAASGSDTREWLELTYDYPMHVTQINIYQTYNPNQVIKVELVDLTANYYEVYTGRVKTESCPYVLTIDVPQTDYLVGGVRITIDQSVLGLGWNEIDAVELVGYAEGGPLPTKPPIASEPPAGFVWRLSRQPGDLFYAGAGLAIGQDGNIYFVDSLARFHVVSPDGEILNTVQDYDYMFVTSDIDIGPDGNLYIADWGSDEHPIIVYTPDGEYVRSWGSKGKGDGEFGDYSPDYLAICNDEVYVVDNNKDDADESYERVQVFDLEGNYLRQWNISEQASFFSTKGIACGPDGNLYLVGFLSNKIISFSPEGEFLGEVGKDPLAGATPSSLAMDADGYFYVGSWNKGVLKVSPQGRVVATWGSNTSEDTERAEGVFKYPDAIVVDADGYVYVVDWGGEYSYMTKFMFP